MNSMQSAFYKTILNRTIKQGKIFPREQQQRWD